MAVSNNWKNLRSFLRKSYNREVNEWFRDIDDAVPDNASSRKQAKRACLILPKESQNMALLKTLTFHFTVQRTHHKPAIFGTPVGTVNTLRKYRPQVVLEFLEDELDVEAGFNRLDGRISFRLMDKTSESLLKSELTTLATNIKTELGDTTGFTWKKGKDMASYTDWDKGYQLQLLVRNKTDAKALIKKVLAIQGHTAEWKRLNYKENDDPVAAFPTIPATTTILGEKLKEPRKRPTASVRFQTAYCNLWGLPQPVVLYDRSFRHFDALLY